MPPNPADYQDRYTSDEVCRAADISPSTLKNWMMRDPPAILMDAAKGDALRAGRGSPLLFSFNRVMQIALTAELTKFGLSLRRAAEISLGFTDIGDGAGGYMGDPGLDAAIQNMRLPGQLYPKGFTLLVGYMDRTAGKTINVTETTKLTELLWSSHTPQGRAEISAIVWVDFIYKRVRLALQG